MNLPPALQLGGLALVAALIGACGGSSKNASPGSVVVEVPVAGAGGGGSDGGGDAGGGGDGDGGTGSGGNTVASAIPASLADIIVDSGATASAAFANKPIYTIDVSATENGAIDPAGVTLGNDFIFEIVGGAARITPPSGAAASVGGSLPDCQLTLAPGAVVVGTSNEDFLVIERGCALIADGTAEQPIVLTAKAEVTGNLEDSDRGLWGGLVINGYAPINDCPEGVASGTAQCTKEGEANSGLFGGANANDNSGTLRYVSVRFAGANVDPENQLNGIAFQAVGAATTVEYIQVHNNLDDGVEFFGGTVDAKYVVLTGNADDSLDWTDGWQGRIQYLYIEQTDAADNAIEADNREGNENAMPRSRPAIANMTIHGKADENALRLRRGTGLALHNSFVDGSATCLRVDGASRGLLGTDLTIAGVSFGCAQMHNRDSDGAVANYLAGATNVAENGDRVDVVALGDGFFDNTDYVGAFGAENWAAGWTYRGSVSKPSQPDFGCPAGSTASSRQLNGRRICQLSGTIAQNMLLSSNNLYELVGKVVVGGDNENTATLTLQAGTTVFGGTDVDFLVISRGSQLVANGTRTAPVVFTSQSDLAGEADIATTRGEWGGLVINGNAPINDCPEGAAGGSAQCSKEGEANSGLFGGDDPNDSSGKLNYVVVKYAGSNVDPENQLNGIAFQGVGAGTVVDYVQVHNNLDDGIEFFGGTVNAKHVVLTGNADDSLDWTDGWQGSIQYLVIDQASDSGDNGIEADNREGNEAATPRSLPKIANMTLTGKAGERAIRLRRGTGLELYNSVVQDSENCLRIQGDSLSQLGTGIRFGGVSFDCDTVVEGDDVAAINSLLASSNVSIIGQAVRAAALGADGFFDATDYIGAVENADEDWTAGWTVGMPSVEADFACPAGTAEVDSIGGRRTCRLAGTISRELTLTRGNHYVLDGKVVVGDAADERSGAVLSIESGTTIIGDNPEDFLVVSRGARIEANGSANAPITFTAAADITNTIADRANARGLWGGLVINGHAPINDCPQGASGGSAQCTKEGEANSGLFGGADAHDSSGTLRYVVVKYAGANVDPENQLNGIAFQGVGDGTTVDYIEVYNNLDDGVEFFGGTVNARHVVLVGNADDSLDWTDGWTGSIQYLHIVQAASAGDNMIEADNREGSEQATPISEPFIANMTMLGKSDERAIRLRRGTGLHLYNSVVSGSERCLRVQGESLNHLGTRIELHGVGLNCPTINEGDDEAAVQAFLDAAASVTQDGSTPNPVTLPAPFDDAGSTIVGSNVQAWGAGWTVGVQ